MVERQPNIVLIVTDQQSADAMRCAGNQHVHTPAIDGLASAGVRFEAAYTAFPLCVPARMSMMTGRMPHEMGIFANVGESDEPCPFPMLGRHLQQAGYHCHYIGKWHLTVPESDRSQHGYAEVVFGGGYGDLDSRKTDAAIGFLENPPAEPFFLSVMFNNPHDCCELARGDALRMGALPAVPEACDLPALPDNWAVTEDEPEVLRAFQRENPGVGCALGWEALETRRYRWGYNRLVEMVDREIGKVLAVLDRTGLRENTLIVFTSDHGDGQGAHHWNQKWCLYDESSRVPLVLVPPGAAKSTGRVERRPAAASLDLFPTLCDYAGVAPPAGLRGQSLRPVVEQSGLATDRAFVAAETSFGNWGRLHEESWAKARMVRTARYKYVAYDRGTRREQLFDMVADPGEMRNLAADRAYADVLATHRALMAPAVAPG